MDKDLLTDLQGGHSAFQLSRFVIARNGAGNVWGRYRQALRELKSRCDALDTAEIERKRTALDIEEKSFEKTKLATSGGHEFEVRRLEIDLEELALKAAHQDESRATLEREHDEVYAAALELKKRLGNLSPEDHAKHERNYWISKLRLQAAVDMLATGRIQVGTLDAIAALEPTDRSEVLLPLRDGGYQKVIEERGCELLEHDDNGS
jgi:hypothetical protein